MKGHVELAKEEIAAKLTATGLDPNLLGRDPSQARR